MPRPLIVGHLNCHNGQRAVRVAAAHGCDVLGLNEAGKRRAQLARLNRYRLHQAPRVLGAPPSPKGRDVSGDTATLVDRDLPYLGHWHQQVSQQVDAASRVAPDRTFTVSCFLYEDQPVAHFNVHPNWGAKTKGTAITREYAESMEWLERMLGLYRAQGYALLVGGDVNMPNLADDPAWSPWPIFRQHGLDVHRAHIDVVGWSRKHFRPAGVQVLGKEQVHSDHPMLVVRLVTA